MTNATLFFICNIYTQICVGEGHESGEGKVEEKLFERMRMEGTSKRKAQRMLRK